MTSVKPMVPLFILWMLFIFSLTCAVMAAQRESTKPKENSSIPPSLVVPNKNLIEIDDQKNGPYIDKTASKNITALLGKTAYLSCRVKNLGNKTMVLQVSWVRHRDIHLLTVGRYTYTSDQRFRAIHHPHSEDWILQIKYPQHRDSGIYECQVSSTPHISHYIQLNVIEPSTEIIGAPDLYIESGSTINLTCVILYSPEPPAYIFWNHNNAIISYDSPRGGVSVITEKGDTTTSFLLIKNARPSDSGQYQCNPSNAKSKSVTVHVLNGVHHSVSRGVPGGNAARGPISSSHVKLSLAPSLHVCAFIYVFLLQNLSTAPSSSACLASAIQHITRLLFRKVTWPQFRSRPQENHSRGSTSSMRSDSYRHSEVLLSLIINCIKYYFSRSRHKSVPNQSQLLTTITTTPMMTKQSSKLLTNTTSLYSNRNTCFRQADSSSAIKTRGLIFHSNSETPVR